MIGNRSGAQDLRPSFRRLGIAAAAPLIFGALVLPYVGGYPLAFLLIGLSVLLVLWTAFDGWKVHLDPASVFFLLAWTLITVAFAVSAKAPRDLIYVVNFLMLLVFAPLRAALAQLSSAGSVRITAVLALLGSALAFAVASYQTWFLQMPRAAGFLSDPIWAAQAAMILGFLALIGIAVPGRYRLEFWLGPLFGTLTAFLAQSRGPLVSVPILLLVALVLLVRRWWLAVPAAVILLGAAIAFIGVLSPSGLARLDTLRIVALEALYGRNIGEVSTSQRFAFYQGSWEAFQREPLVGYGWAHKIEAVRPFLPEGGAMLNEGHHHLHSDIADLAISAGSLGLLAYVLIIAAPVVGALATPRDGGFRARLAGTVFLSGAYFFCGLTYLMFGYEFHTTLYIVLAAILLGWCRGIPEVPVQPTTWLLTNRR